MINPDAGNLGVKVGFVFFGLGAPFCIAFWFLVPETKGLTFEDVSSDPAPRLTMKGRPKLTCWCRWTTSLPPRFRLGILRGSG